MQSKIQTIQHAQDLWERFNQKYTNLIPGISDTKKLRYEKKLSDEEPAAKKYEDVDIRRARILQRFWQRKRAQDTLIPINLNGNHHGNFKHLVNQQPIKRSLNAQKQALLQEAMVNAHWDAPIFKDDTLPQLAMSLFASGKITQQQVYSILERAQTIQDYAYEKTYSILDENNQFTPEAKELLIKKIQHLKYLNPLSAQQLETFRLLILTLPPSERFFYTTSYHRWNNLHSLAHRLYHLDAVYLISNQVLNLSCGARDALGLARFGEEYVRPMPRLGKLSVDDIEHGVVHAARYAALGYPETQAYGDVLHGWSNVNHFEAISHDIYHGHIMSLIPSNLLKALQRFASITRNQTGHRWSKEIWDWIDGDFNHFFHNRIQTNNFNSRKTTTLFCDMLMYGTGSTKPEYIQGGYLTQTHLSTSSFELTLHGAMIYLDMIQNQSEWLKLNINPNYLGSPFYEHYNAIKNIYAFIQDDDLVAKIAKCMLYVAYSQKTILVKPDVIFNFINQTKEKFSIKKRKKSDTNDKDLINTIYLAYGDQAFSLNNGLKQMILDACIYTDEIQKTNFCSAILNGYTEKEAHAYVTYMETRSAQDFARLHWQFILSLFFATANMIAACVYISIDILLYIPIQIYKNVSPWKANHSDEKASQASLHAQHGIFSTKEGVKMINKQPTQVDTMTFVD